MQNIDEIAEKIVSARNKSLLVFFGILFSIPDRILYLILPKQILASSLCRLISEEAAFQVYKQIALCCKNWPL
jgi:hypothetical protein